MNLQHCRSNKRPVGIIWFSNWQFSISGLFQVCLLLVLQNDKAEAQRGLVTCPGLRRLPLENHGSRNVVQWLPKLAVWLTEPKILASAQGLAECLSFAQTHHRQTHPSSTWFWQWPWGSRAAINPIFYRSGNQGWRRQVTGKVSLQKGWARAFNTDPQFFYPQTPSSLGDTAWDG